MRDRNRLLSFALVAFALAACSPNAPQSPGTVKLSPVDALPKPSLPPWIASISPTGRAQSLAQIRVIFAKPVAPVEALEGDGPKNVLSHMRIEPELKGRFVLLTPKMAGFVAEEALPVGARVRVTLTSGLSDLAGDALSSDLAWTFETAPLAFSDLPNVHVSPDQSTPSPAPLHPTISIASNALVDAATLAAHATLESNGTSIPLKATLEPTPTPAGSIPPDAQTAFGASDQTWTYDLEPERDLERATTYRLTIAPGVEPARGNVATATTFSGSVRTFDRLVVTPTATPGPSGASGSRFAQGDPVIAFSNPIDAKTIQGNITISPAVSPSPAMTLSGDAAVAIDPYALEPLKQYTLMIGPGLKDVFGQSVASPAPIDVHTGDFAPGMWAPSGRTLVPANAGIDINLYATNLPGNAYRAAFAGVAPLDVLQGIDASSLLPSPAPRWPVQRLPDAKRNVQSIVRISVADRLHHPFGSLAYGFWSEILGAADATPIVGTVQLTNLGVFAQFFPASAAVMVQHLDDGSPARASIAVYRMPGDASQNGAPQQCASGSTDDSGTYVPSPIDLQRCYVNAGSNEIPELGIVATEGGDLATLRVFDYSGIYRFDVPSGWASGAPDGVGTIFPDRDMYQPGERGVFTGVAYYTQAGSVHADPNARYALQLEDPNGAKTDLGSVTTDAYGMFSKDYTFSPAQPLGYYTLRATGDHGAKITGSFRVAEFKPPNFKVDVALDKTAVTQGSNVLATADAQYLFGAPLAGGKAHVYVTRSYATLAPKGWDDFWFGRQWFWPEQQPSLTSDVLQQDQQLDGKGMTQLNVPVPAELPAPLQYSVEFEATDVSNLSVSNSKTFLAMPNDAAIGLASDTVGAAKKPMPIRVIVTDPDGKPVAGRNVHLELQKMTYVWASQAQEGGEEAQDSVKYDTVDRTDITSADKPVTANLTPSDAGSYRVRANFAGASSDASASDLQVFSYGSNAADFGAQDRTSVRVTLDKKTYKIGDTATALIGSPFQKADVYVAVIRYGTIYRTILHQATGAPRVSFKITPEMFPNAAIQAVVVRRGPKLSSIKPGTLDSLARTGMAGFSIDLHDRYVKIGITPEHATLEPGSQQRVSFALTDANGKPVRGKIVAMAVNDAILQLSGYRLPDLVTTIFASQPISTRFADNRDDVTLQSPQVPVEKGFGYGGGFLEGAAGTRVRTNFLPLAYYGSARSDANGRASVSFKLPDDLTTWRVMAVAIADGNARFGTNDATFISRLPLMANALLPQFARPGDRIEIGASVMNQTGGPGALDLGLHLTGALAFASGDRQNVELQTTTPQGIAAYRYSVAVSSPAPSSLSVRAAMGSAKDAFSVPFQVRDRGVTESVVDAGAGKGDIVIPVHLTQPGTVVLTLANSVVPQMKMEGARALTDDPVQTTNELGSRVIIGAGIGSKTVTSDLALLEKLQRDDGGFRYYSGEKASDPFASAYALESLSYARAHNVAVPASVLSAAAAYARNLLANPNRNRWCGDELCKAQTRFAMLWALAGYGERRSDWLQSIYAQRDRFDNATQIRLARYLLATSGWQSTGKAYADSLQQALYITGRYATANLNTRWAWRDQIVDAQSQMLQLLLDRNAPADQLDGAARAIIAQKCRCGWSSTEGAASAVMALSAYTAHAPPVAMHVIVRSGGQTVSSATFGSAAQSTNVTLPAASLKGDSISLRADEGTLHYVLLYTYALASDAPGNLTAFRVMRQLYEPGTTRPFATIDLAAPAPLESLTGRVFDVGLRIAVDHPVDRVVIEDPLPSGFEAVDTSFATSIQSVVPQSDNWEIESRQIYRDRVVAFAPFLGPGVYEMHYLVRSVTPGTFRWPGAHVYLEDAPEQFGRSAAASLTLKER